MQRLARRKLRQGKRTLLAKTDIVSFYESVDFDTLMNDIDELEIRDYNTGLLKLFLDGYQQSREAWGLPQGPEVSGILANLYLSPIDDFLARNRVDYLRFSDDIDIFGGDWSELRSVLLEVNHLMRARRLPMSTSKTRIYDPADALKAFEDSEKDAISYKVQTKGKAAAAAVEKYFDKVVKADQVSPRDFRFALYRLGLLQDKHAVSWCLGNIEQNPHLAKEIFDYLYKFKDISTNIGRYLTRISRKSDLITNPTLDRQIIEFFLSRDKKDQYVKDLAWAAIEDKNKNVILREYSSRYVGRNSGRGDGQRLIFIYQNETDLFVRRSLLIGAYEARYCPRKLLESLCSEKTDTQWTAHYLLDGPSVPLPRNRG
nr:RNA-directed DNA polymerase [Amycolatopsis taiwanensis]